MIWRLSGFKVCWIQKLTSHPWKQTHFSCLLEQTPVLTSLSLKEHHFICTKAQNKILFMLRANTLIPFTLLGKIMLEKVFSWKESWQPANVVSSNSTSSNTAFPPAFSSCSVYQACLSGDTATVWRKAALPDTGTRILQVWWSIPV